MTHALLKGSLAINHLPAGTNGCGTTISTDQRGVIRPQGAGCDIGAYEAKYYILTAGLAGSGSGTVTSDPAGIVCGGDCSESYQEYTVVTLTTSVGTGSIFTGWSGACASDSGDCVVTMSAARSVTATFDLIADTEHLIYLPFINR